MNGFWNKLISILLSITVIGINLAFIISRINLAHLSGSWIALIGIYLCLYNDGQEITFLFFFFYSDIFNILRPVLYIFGHTYDLPNENRWCIIAIKFCEKICN